MRLQKRDLSEAKEKVNYNLSLPEDLYEKIREEAFKSRQSIALVLQTAIEDFFSKPWLSASLTDEPPPYDWGEKGPPEVKPVEYEPEIGFVVVEEEA